MTASAGAHVAVCDGLSDDVTLPSPADVPTARAVPAHRPRGTRLGRPAGLLVVPVARVGDLVALPPLPAPDGIRA